MMIRLCNNRSLNAGRHSQSTHHPVPCFISPPYLSSYPKANPTLATRTRSSPVTTADPSLVSVQPQLVVPTTHEAVDTGRLSTTPPPEPQQSFKGYAELLIVTLLWGSYNPTLKLIYAEDNPLDPAALTAVRTVLSAAALAAAVLVKRQTQSPNLPEATGSGPGGLQPLQRGSEAAEIQDPLLLPTSSRPQQLPSSSLSPQPPTTLRASPMIPLLTMTFGGVVAAGIELGLYNFAGTSLQAVGVQLTSATRAGFLQQFIVVLTPALSYLAGENIPSKVWVAVAVGLLGSIVVACDGLPLGTTLVAAGGSSGPEDMTGTVCLLASCLFYSLAVVRLSMYAPKFCSVDLTAVKKGTLGAASLVWLFVDISQQQQGLPLDAQLSAVGFTGHSLSSWLLVLFSGLGPGALATYLQTRGMVTVPAVTAQVIFSLTPLWSAGMAFVLLGDDGMGTMSWLGGGAVVVAGLMAAQAQAQAQASGGATRQS